MFTHSFFLSNPCKFIFAARSGQARIWLTRGGFKEVIHGRHVREEQINSDARGPNWQSAGNSRPSPSSWPLSDTWMGGVMESTFGWWNGELNCTPSSHHHRRQTRPPLLYLSWPTIGWGGGIHRQPACACCRHQSASRAAGYGEDSSVGKAAT